MCKMLLTFRESFVINKSNQEERTMTIFSNASARRMANKIMNLEEGKIQNILSGLEPEFKKQVVITIIQKRIQKGRENA